MKNGECMQRECKYRRCEGLVAKLYRAWREFKFQENFKKRNSKLNCYEKLKKHLCVPVDDCEFCFKLIVNRREKSQNPNVASLSFILDEISEETERRKI